MAAELSQVAVLAVRTLAPAESLVFGAERGARPPDASPASPGRYTVRGALPAGTPDGPAT